jgi:uncharacterized membrane protein
VNEPVKPGGGLTVYVTLVVGLVWWLAAWAFGIKAFDAFLLTVALLVGAAAYVMAKPFLDKLTGREVATVEDEGARP